MKITNFLVAIGGIVFVGFAGWQIGGKLSSDAIGMALGVLFGIMAGIPASLMVLAAKRQESERFRDDYRHRPPLQIPEQPPVIVVASKADEPERQQITINRRQFRVVGENEGIGNPW